MSWFMVDIEADGPCPGLFSMVSFGVVLVREPLETSPTFYGKVCPLAGADWQPDTLAISGHTRQEHCKFPEPVDEMKRFDEWITANSVGRPMLISDNVGWDNQFISYYFWNFLGKNPFGHSSTNIGSLYKGLVKDTRKNFKHLRITKHSHHPVEDSLGNSEALIAMKQMGLNITLE